MNSLKQLPLFLLLSLALAAPAIAKDGLSPTMVAYGRAPSTGTQRLDKQLLQRGPSLPFVPQYTGKQAMMLDFAYCPNLPGGQSYTMRFETLESAQVVRDWFTDSLPSSGWQLDPDTNNKCAITARKDRMQCYIYTRNSRESGYKAEVVLRLSISPS